MTDFSALSGPELLTAYNVLAKKAGLKHVARFSDRKAAIRRCLALSASPPAPAGKNTPSTSPAVPASPPGTKETRILAEFKARAGTNRETLLRVMIASFGKQVNLAELMKAVYNSTDEKNRGALGMVMKGAYAMIEKRKLPYRIVREKKEKEVTYGLHQK